MSELTSQESQIHTDKWKHYSDYFDREILVIEDEDFRLNARSHLKLLRDASIVTENTDVIKIVNTVAETLVNSTPAPTLSYLACLETLNSLSNRGLLELHQEPFSRLLNLYTSVLDSRLTYASESIVDNYFMCAALWNIYGRIPSELGISNENLDVLEMLTQILNTKKLEVRMPYIETVVSEGDEDEKIVTEGFPEKRRLCYYGAITSQHKMESVAKYGVPVGYDFQPRLTNALIGVRFKEEIGNSATGTIRNRFHFVRIPSIKKPVSPAKGIYTGNSFEDDVLLTKLSFDSLSLYLSICVLRDINMWLSVLTVPAKRPGKVRKIYDIAGPRGLVEYYADSAVRNSSQIITEEIETENKVETIEYPSILQSALMEYHASNNDEFDINQITEHLLYSIYCLCLKHENSTLRLRTVNELIELYTRNFAFNSSIEDKIQLVRLYLSNRDIVELPPINYSEEEVGLIRTLTEEVRGYDFNNLAPDQINSINSLLSYVMRLHYETVEDKQIQRHYS